MTDLEYERLAARFSDDGVYGTPADDPVVTAGPGLNVTVRAEVYASLRGHGWSSGGQDVVLPIASNVSGQTRNDRVVLRLDRATWTVRAVVKQGAPGGRAPALTQDTGVTGVYEIRLADVAVLNGATAVTVTRGELYVGSRRRPCTSTSRNPNPVPGEEAFETDTGRVVMWDGATWRTVYQDSGEVILQKLTLAGWSINAADSVLVRKDGIVTLRMAAFERRIQSLPAATETRLPVVLPGEFQPPTRSQHFTVTITGLRVGRVTIYAKNDAKYPGQIWLTEHPTMAVGESVSAESLTWAV
ncbi:hypothetical protein [Streptomyces ardesiacus]|uniref:hypothetical protein n=1 Tax=Streptomyces ardesiacus TaxID=285564 RepID=UPI0036324A46